MATGEVPESLRGKELLSLDLGLMIVAVLLLIAAGTATFGWLPAVVFVGFCYGGGVANAAAGLRDSPLMHGRSRLVHPFHGRISRAISSRSRVSISMSASVTGVASGLSMSTYRTGCGDTAGVACRRPAPDNRVSTTIHC